MIGGMADPIKRRFGRFGGAPTASAARFDTEENKWQEIAPLNEARWGAFGVSKNEEKIFIAGGRGILKFHSLKSCEVYNIATDEWQSIASLTVPRKFGKMELRDGTIYVLGGMTQSGRFPRGRVPVEWYDHDRDMWFDKSKMPVSNIPFMGSMMS